MSKTEDQAAEIQRLQGEWDVVNQKLLASESKYSELSAERDQLRTAVAALEAELATRPPAPVVQAVAGGFLEYPKVLYFKGDPKNYQEVKSVEAEVALGDDWIDAPVSV